jgi:hypothetical protein
VLYRGFVITIVGWLINYWEFGIKTRWRFGFELIIEGIGTRGFLSQWQARVMVLLGDCVRWIWEKESREGNDTKEWRTKVSDSKFREASMKMQWKLKPQEAMIDSFCGWVWLLLFSRATLKSCFEELLWRMASSFRLRCFYRESSWWSHQVDSFQWRGVILPLIASLYSLSFYEVSSEASVDSDTSVDSEASVDSEQLKTLRSSRQFKRFLSDFYSQASTHVSFKPPTLISPKRYKTQSEIAFKSPHFKSQLLPPRNTS